MKRTIKSVLACALLAATMSACSGAAPAATNEKTVTFATVPGFDDTVAITGLWTELLDEKGYNVQTRSVDLAAGFSGIARGDLDGYLNTWLPSTHATYVEKYKDNLDIVKDNGPFFDKNQLVLAVPDSVPEKTIADVVEHADKYDSKVIGIEAGSGLMKLLPDVLAKYSATDKLKVVEGSTPAALAALKSGVNSNKPVVVALWKPHWAYASMPIRALEDNANGWPGPDGSYVVLSKAFAQKQPEIRGWMSKSKLTEEQYSTLMLAVSEAKDPVAGAKNWLEQPGNRDAVNAWFN